MKRWIAVAFAALWVGCGFGSFSFTRDGSPGDGANGGDGSSGTDAGTGGDVPPGSDTMTHVDVPPGNDVVMPTDGGDGGTSGACDGGATAPRLISPMSTSTVTKNQPTLTWSYCRSVQVVVCSDSNCANQPMMFAATGTSATVPSALTAGVYWWHVQDGTQVSATWEFWVAPSYNTAVDTSFGTTLDVDRDGFADLVVGADNNYGSASLYYGGSSGLSPSAHSIPLPANWMADARFSFGHDVASVGDIDGDGYGDFAIGAPEDGSAFVYFGGPRGSSPRAPVEVDYNGSTCPAAMAPCPAYISGVQGSGVASAGDYDRDGYGDLATIGIDPTTQMSSAIVFYGSGSFDGSNYAAVQPISASAMVANGGDVVPGGFGGFFMGTDGTADPSVVVFPTQSDPAVTLGPPMASGSNPGAFVANAADINGDGYSDVVALLPPYTTTSGAQPAALCVFLSSGPANYGGCQQPPAPLTAVDSTYPGAVGVADVDGDGFADVVVGGHHGIYVFSGAANPTWNNAPSPISLPGACDWTQSSAPFVIANAGDVNGDHFADVAVGGCYTSMATYVMYGSATGLRAANAVTLPGGDYSFGDSVAWAAFDGGSWGHGS